MTAAKKLAKKATKKAAKVAKAPAKKAAATKAAPKTATKAAPNTAQKTAGGNDRDAIRDAFLAVVNMKPGELTDWLKTKDSHVVGAKDGRTGTAATGPESVGHRSGRRIVTLLGKDADALTAGDVAHMRKVIGYVHRHLAQRPSGEDVEHSRWRYSLMNWGHDPAR